MPHVQSCLRMEISCYLKSAINWYENKQFFSINAMTISLLYHGQIVLLSNVSKSFVANYINIFARIFCANRMRSLFWPKAFDELCTAFGKWGTDSANFDLILLAFSFVGEIELWFFSAKRHAPATFFLEKRKSTLGLSKYRPNFFCVTVLVK